MQAAPIPCLMRAEGGSTHPVLHVLCFRAAGMGFRAPPVLKGEHVGHIAQHIPEQGRVQLLPQEPLSRGQRRLLLPRLLLLPPAHGPRGCRGAQGESERRRTPQQRRAEGAA